MSRQVNYIIEASFILLILATGTLIAKKIPLDQPPQPVEPVFTTTAGTANYDGKILFQSKCASCHNPFKDGTGPALAGLLDRGSWTDSSKLYAWIRDPAAFMQKDSYTKSLKLKYGSMMTAFPDLSNKQIDAIFAYLNLHSMRVY